MGYALVVPGVKDFYGRYERSNGVKIIDGTGDVISPTTFPTREAQRYATAYNELLLRHLKANEKKRPDEAVQPLLHRTAATLAVFRRWRNL